MPLLKNKFKYLNLWLQAALDDAEKRCFAANRELELKTAEVGELADESMRARDALDVKLKQSAREIARLHAQIR